MSIKRIFVNSYLAYSNDTGETLTNFIADFPTAINNPKDVSIMNVSLLNYPRYPNFTPRENNVYLQVDIAGTIYNLTIRLDPTLIYGGPSDPNGVGYINVEDELNKDSNILSIPALPNDFETDVGQFSYNEALQNFVFTPVNPVTFQNGANDAYRRIGLRKTLLNVEKSAAFTFLNPPILARCQVVYLCSNISNDSMINSKGISYNSNIMMQVPVYNPSFGSITNYEPSFNWGKLAYPRSFSSLEFTILDDQFFPMEFATNANLLLGVEITYNEVREKESVGQIQRVGFSKPTLF